MPPLHADHGRDGHFLLPLSMQLPGVLRLWLIRKSSMRMFQTQCDGVLQSLRTSCTGKVCLFCVHYIMEQMNGKCPACRQVGLLSKYCGAW